MDGCQREGGAVEAKGHADIAGGYYAVRHAENDALYLVRNGDRLITFFPGGLTYMDITGVEMKEEENIKAFDYLFFDGPHPGYTPEEWAVPFIKRWDAVLIMGKGGPW